MPQETSRLFRNLPIEAGAELPGSLDEVRSMILFAHRLQIGAGLSGPESIVLDCAVPVLEGCVRRTMR